MSEISAIKMYSALSTPRAKRMLVRRLGATVGREYVPRLSPEVSGEMMYQYTMAKIRRAAQREAGLGVTPATDTSPPPPAGKVNVPRTAVVITLVVLGLGGLWWLNELDDKDSD